MLPVNTFCIFCSAKSDEFFGHVLAGEDVEMQVRHGLAGGLAGVRDDAESGVQALLGGYLGYDLENVRHCGGVLRCYLRGGVRDVLFRDDEDMRGGLGVDIPEGRAVSLSKI